MEKYNYILGLDMGVSSVGWACMLVDQNNEPFRILDLGSRIFDPEGSSMEDRRIARGTRRVLRRRKARVTKTKNLFTKYNYLSKEDIEKVYNSKGIAMPDPYQIKIKGKKDKLTYEELLIALVHYAKGRGFKSNRKIEDNDASDSKSANEEQKLLFAKQKMEKDLAERKEKDPLYTFTNLLLDKKVDKYTKIRNTSGDYTYGITRKMIQEEVLLLLETQMKFELINQDFIDEFKEILLRQRMFSEGPDTGPYHNPLEQMIGRCGFTGDPRAPRAALTYELFTLVQKLQSIRYTKTGSNEKLSLSKNQIHSLINKAKNKETISYKTVRKEIGEDNVHFSGLQLSREEYGKVVEILKKDPSKELKNEIEKAKDGIKIYKMENFATLINSLKKLLGKDPVLTDQQYDLIADCLTRNKSDIEIIKYLEGNREILKDISIPEEVKDAVVLLNDKGFKEFGKVSLSFLYKILPVMLEENKDYYEACQACDFDHSKKHSNEEEMDYVPIINDILEKLDKTITNRSVTRTLVETRKVVNAVLRKYGKPIAIHLEMARELTKSKDERVKTMYEQLDNENFNASLRFQIFSQHPDKFRSVQNVSGADLIQYKLFIEQKGICPYTLAMTGDENLSKINEKELFTHEVEVDHIIPYTICFDDRYVNKVLVKKVHNQNKGNKIPMVYLNSGVGLNKYSSWLKTNSNISADKKERFLTNEVDEKFLNDYRARTINDTRYAIKAFKDILDFSFPNIKIRTFTGQITAKLRGVWGLNGLTHSWEAKDHKKKNEVNAEIDLLYLRLSELYLKDLNRKSKEFKAILNEIRKKSKEDAVKNRENHLHHAVDAAIIACATEKVRRRVEIHEMVMRQKGTEEMEVLVPIEIEIETGEVKKFEKQLISFEQYKQDLRMQTDDGRIKFPQPYPLFARELEFRTYEMDETVLRDELKNYSNYQDVDIDELKPLFVSHHFASKISGRMHKATFYGLKKSEKGQILTGRMSINSEKFDEKNLEKIYDKEKTQSYIYSAVKDWLNEYKNGAEAFKVKGLPKNKNGNPIKKVKLDEGLLKEEFSIQQDIKQYVAKEDVAEVHVYTKENDDKLYFVGMDRFRLTNIKRREDIELLLWWGQGKNNVKVKCSELKENGFDKEPLKLMKGQIILVEKKDGTKGICKIVGFASGKFEVESILGDGFDIVQSKMFNDLLNRYPFTVSTIKSIKPISVDILGKIHSNV